LPTGDWPDIGLSGYRHRRSGAAAGTGPDPKNVRVGFPLNIVSPFTEPHGLNTVSGVTTPSGLSGTVVIVDSGGSVEVVNPPSSIVVFAVSGGSVASVSSGPTEITLSPLATHALATIDIANTRRISLFTAAILGMGPL
jgi:hypothetical protein